MYAIRSYYGDIRLSQIWTGTNEIMNLLIQHEYFQEVLEKRIDRRDIEQDAMHADDAEKVYTDEDQERGMKR